MECDWRYNGFSPHALSCLKNEHTVRQHKETEAEMTYIGRLPSQRTRNVNATFSQEDITMPKTPLNAPKFSNRSTNEPVQPEKKPNLGELYKPVGIQAVAAATSCRKTPQMHKSVITPVKNKKNWH